MSEITFIQSGITPRPEVDLRKWASAVEDQYRLGSCSGNALVGAYELLTNLIYPAKQQELSRLFVYYNARLIAGDENADAGAYIVHTIEAVRRHGICTEKIWPYDIASFAITPSAESYADAASRNIKNYARLSNISDMIDALTNNHPVVFSTKIYSNFDDIGTGNFVVTSPAWFDVFRGVHAMCAVGYNLEKNTFIVRNSFGTEWGLAGYCDMTFEYAAKEFIEMWIFDIHFVDVVNQIV